MRSLSDVLIKKREEKGLTISQVAYETNISKKYIEALEEEDFTVFPAEAYLLGFLRNYAEFLGLEYEFVNSEYKNCLLREEPTPLSELMGMKKTFELKPWMIIVPVIFITLLFGVPAIIKTVGSQIEKRKEALRLAGEDKTQLFTIDDDYSGKKVKVGDSLILTIAEEELTYFVNEVDSELILTESFKGSDKVINLKLGTEVLSVFTNANEKYTITLFLKDIGGFSDGSAIIKIKREIKEVVNFDDIDEEIIDSSSIKEDARVLMVKKHSPEPYSISITFEGNILFRYQQKGQNIKENFYQKGSVLNLDVTRSIQLWTSNAGLTKFKLDGDTLVLGRTGEVHVFTLRWIYTKDKDEYRLEYAKSY